MDDPIWIAVRVIYYISVEIRISSRNKKHAAGMRGCH